MTYVFQQNNLPSVFWNNKVFGVALSEIHCRAHTRKACRDMTSPDGKEKKNIILPNRIVGGPTRVEQLNYLGQKSENDIKGRSPASLRTSLDVILLRNFFSRSSERFFPCCHFQRGIDELAHSGTMWLVSSWQNRARRAGTEIWLVSVGVFRLVLMCSAGQSINYWLSSHGVLG